MAKDYKQLAQAQYDPAYNAKRTAILNELASNQQALQNQITGINQNYDKAVYNQNLSNKKLKNNISNAAIGRGLTRGTAVTSSLAEADQINNRLVGNINLERTGALNNIEAQKALLQQNTNNVLATMAGDRESAILALARELEDRDFAKSIQNRQLEIQMQNAAAERAYRNMQLALQREAQALEQQRYNYNMQLERDRFNLEKSKYYDTKNKEAKDFYNNAIFEASKIYKDDSISNEEKYKQLNKLAFVYNSVNDPTYKNIGNQLAILSSKAYNKWQDELKKQNKNSTKTKQQSQFWENKRWISPFSAI
jgi:hypothetical protein